MHIASVRAASLVQQSSYSSAPDRAAVYCDERVCLSVCVCVCVFVCPRSYLQNYTSDLRQFL